jgi:2-polyprenyl-3-methyl-5-hydroxy-6-metoxy-1,4-benzoquinol methylase
MTEPLPPSAPPPAKRTGVLAGLWHELVYAFDRTFKTGRRRAEFEHKYRTRGDYFAYRSSPYELAKYERTLTAIREWRAGRGRALEIGCSVGVFTRAIAEEFDAVTAVDIAQEALLLAEKEVGGRGHVSYHRSDLVSLDLGQTFDVIICAEVLMYVPERDADLAGRVLDQHLAPGGLIIEVSQKDRTSNAKFFHGWDRVLGTHFDIRHRQVFEDPQRPYEIVGYVRVH